MALGIPEQFMSSPVVPPGAPRPCSSKAPPRSYSTHRSHRRRRHPGEPSEMGKGGIAMVTTAMSGGIIGSTRNRYHENSVKHLLNPRIFLALLSIAGDVPWQFEIDLQDPVELVAFA